MVERAQRGTPGAVTAVVLVVSALALLGNAIVPLLPVTDDTAPNKVMSNSDLMAAYERIQPGQTHASQLSQFGLDATADGAQTLSYLGVLERFATHDSVRFDRLDPAIKDCVAVPDHCTALVFRSAIRTPTEHGLFTAYALGAAAPTPPIPGGAATTTCRPATRARRPPPPFARSNPSLLSTRFRLLPGNR